MLQRNNLLWKVYLRQSNKGVVKASRSPKPEPIEVIASHCQINDNGDLIFLDSKMTIVQAFPSGLWESVILVED